MRIRSTAQRQHDAELKAKQSNINADAQNPQHSWTRTFTLKSKRTVEYQAKCAIAAAFVEWYLSNDCTTLITKDSNRAFGQVIDSCRMRTRFSAQRHNTAELKTTEHESNWHSFTSESSRLFWIIRRGLLASGRVEY